MVDVNESVRRVDRGILLRVSQFNSKNNIGANKIDKLPYAPALS